MPGWPSGYGAGLLRKEPTVPSRFNLPSWEEKQKTQISRFPKGFPGSNPGPGVSKRLYAR